MAKTVPFLRAAKNFKGFLEARGKALLTIKSYETDIRSFTRFLAEQGIKPSVSIQSLSSATLQDFHEWLKKCGDKVNTRRRKVLTLRRFLRFLEKRGSLDTEMSQILPAPQKVERVPRVLDISNLQAAIRALPNGNDQETRNVALIFVLAETGCLVSEVSGISWSDFEVSEKEATLQLGVGQRERTISVSLELYELVSNLFNESRGDKLESPLFKGFNRYGPIHSRITSRGVELVVRAYAKRLSYPLLTPRLIKHSVVLGWLRAGITQGEVQKRLGLKTTYAFRAYESLYSQAADSNKV